MYNTLCSRNEIYEYVRGCETRGVDCEVAAAWIGGRGRWYGACLLLLACERLIRGSFLISCVRPSVWQNVVVKGLSAGGNDIS
jgi:hypothetical protein